ncbi:hypothetical protein VTL71DRAFT_16574 [Oculimacula yallundae]|uniref:Heterokaryon incompatibility domain-containing protein n=1 Tax=Oculimacula yallundae TaxID=86028 RepID=A0ABR4CGV7_9HELO
MRPSSEASIALMKSWLNTCLNSHSSCPHPSLDFLPTRLIAIPEAREERVRMWCTTGQKAEPYAALSYCWGQQGQATTTRENINSHLEKIVIESVPKTIQEAVEIARGLGIPNLWVDSLCIIQDDPMDKAVEVAQMPLVYSQATLIISAARSKDVHEGFLGDRSDIFEEHFQLPYRRLDGRLETVSLFNVETRGSEPLDSRAWALQEKFLATRLLEFGRCQTQWTCQSKAVGTLIDGYKHYVSPQYAVDGLSRAILSLLRGEEVSSSDMSGAFPYEKTFSNTPGSEGSGSEMVESVGSDSSSTSLRSFSLDWPPSKPYNIWRNLVQVYNVRELTLQSDRLPAISGLACRFAELIDDQYCAGIWKSRLPHDLLWYMFSEDNHGQHQRCQGPSWSWASAPGSLYYRNEYDHVDQDSSIQIVDSHIELVNEHNLYGAVHSGTLTVEGCLQDAAWYWEASEWQAQSGNAILQKSLVKISHDEALPVKLIDYPGTQNKQPLNPVILLPIKSNRRRRRGLVLQHISDEQYVRVGVFHTSVERIRGYGFSRKGKTEILDALDSIAAWFESGQVKTITIV